MSLNGTAWIVGAYEHPTRKADDKSLAQLHADVAKGALEDAGFFCIDNLPVPLLPKVLELAGAHGVEGRVPQQYAFAVDTRERIRAARVCWRASSRRVRKCALSAPSLVKTLCFSAVSRLRF